MLVEQMPLPCDCCHRTILVEVSEAQQLSSVTCGHCGARIAIDKDAASRMLAELELHGSTPFNNRRTGP